MFTTLPSLLDITGIRVLHRNVRNLSLFTTTCKHSPSARCVSAANLCAKTSVFRKAITLLILVLHQSVTFFNQLIYVFQSLGFLSQYFVYIAFLPAILFLYCLLVLCFCVFILFLCSIFSLYWHCNNHLCC